MSASDAQWLEPFGGGPLVGQVTVPGDKSISHRALLLAALAEGSSRIDGLSSGDDVVRTRSAITALGAEVIYDGQSTVVTGGRHRLRPPHQPIDLGNSGTGMRLLAGMAASLTGSTTLTGDQSLCSRPMDRVARPLEAMGATMVGHGERCLPPLTVTGASLHGIEYAPPMASAQVKGAVLLAGLGASGETVVHEVVATRTHTEDMLVANGADLEISRHGGGRTIRLRPSVLHPVDRTVPGDPSQAAFWIVAAVIVPGSRVTVRHVQLGAERIGFVHVLRRMGAAVAITAESDDVGHLTADYSPLQGTEVMAAEIPSLDEVPILAVAAMAAQGTTRFVGVGELRVKESDRLAGTAALVRAFGGMAEVDGDDLVVGGGRPVTAGQLDAHGDHRMAMAAAVAAVAVTGGEPSLITGWEAVATSYPGFADTLAGLRQNGRP